MIAMWEESRMSLGRRCVATPPTLGQGLGHKNHQLLEDKRLLKFQQEGAMHDHKRVPLRTSLDKFNSVTQSCPTLCNPMNCSTPVLPVHNELWKFTQTHVY